MRISYPLNWVYPTHNLKEPVSDQPDRLFLVAPLFLFQTFHHAHIGRANDFVCADKFFHTVSTPPNDTGHSEIPAMRAAIARETMAFSTSAAEPEKAEPSGPASPFVFLPFPAPGQGLKLPERSVIISASSSDLLRGYSEESFMKVFKMLLFGAVAAGIAWNVWYAVDRKSVV